MAMDRRLFTYVVATNSNVSLLRYNHLLKQIGLKINLIPVGVLEKATAGVGGSSTLYLRGY
jgi:hypothetical protein